MHNIHNKQVATPVTEALLVPTCSVDILTKIKANCLEKQVSNPISTGGLGFSFENKVQAFFAVHMLSRTEITWARPGYVTAIHLQASWKGIRTDDAVVEFKNKQEQQWKLSVQVKHSFAISLSDKVFASAIAAAWRDFNDPTVFNPQSDSFVLITGPLSAAITDNFRVMLTWARSSQTASDFFQKIGV